MIRLPAFCCATVALCLAVGATQAAVPGSMSYQGFLTDRFGSPISDTLDVEFSIYTAPAGGSPLWMDSQDVVLFQGLFSVELGSDVNPFPPDLFETPLYLGIKIGTDTEMVPRRSLTSVAFAFQAEDARTIEGLTIADLQADLAPGVRLMMSSESLGRVILYETSDDIPSSSADVTLLTDTGLLLRGRYSPGESPSFRNRNGNLLHFSEPGCTGQAFLTTAPQDPLISEQGIAFMAGNPLRPYYIPRAGQFGLAQHSSAQGPNGDCMSTFNEIDAWYVFPNDPAVTGLPDVIDGFLVLE